MHRSTYHRSRTNFQRGFSDTRDQILMRKMIEIRIVVVIVMLSAAGSVRGALAKTPPPSSPAQHVVTLAPVVVTGVVPGPALWKISKNDHVMWVLGITSPLPKHMQWDATKVDRLIASSRRVLKLPGYYLYAKFEPSQGVLTPSAMDAAKHLPSGKTLQQVLPPDLYKRWVADKDKYMHGLYKWGVDTLRPEFAATKLYDAALRQSELAYTGTVEDAVYAAARKHDVPVESTEYTLKMTNPNKLLSQFDQTSAQDQECLRSTLDAVDQNFPRAIALANAWATGDLPTLRKLLSVKQQDPCFLGYAEMVGVNDISRRVQEAWLTAAQKALAQDTQSVALLPMSELVTENGYLDVLAKDGYTVQAPASLDDSVSDH